MMIRLTLVYFALQTAALALGFMLRSDWVFYLLALVNLAAGPLILFLFASPGLRPKKRAAGGPPSANGSAASG